MSMTPTDLESMLSEFDGIDFEERSLELAAIQIHNEKSFPGTIPAHFAKTELDEMKMFEMEDTKVRVSDTKLRDVAVVEVCGRCLAGHGRPCLTSKQNEFPNYPNQGERVEKYNDQFIEQRVGGQWWQLDHSMKFLSRMRVNGVITHPGILSGMNEWGGLPILIGVGSTSFKNPAAKLALQSYTKMAKKDGRAMPKVSCNHHQQHHLPTCLPACRPACLLDLPAPPSDHFSGRYPR